MSRAMRGQLRRKADFRQYIPACSRLLRCDGRLASGTPELGGHDAISGGAQGNYPGWTPWGPPPPAIYCIGLNYKRHAAEVNLPFPQYPVVFMKPATSIIFDREPIVVPAICDADEVDWEVELAVVIGETCRDVKVDHALSMVRGYTVANDISARRWQGKKGGSQWSRSKSFDSFLPLGPKLVGTDEIPDPSNLNLSTTINGEVVQNSSTADMIFSVAEIISFLSQGTTLLPGTIITTGTPEGVGLSFNPTRYLAPGDEVTVTIDGIGSLTNRVEVQK